MHTKVLHSLYSIFGHSSIQCPLLYLTFTSGHSSWQRLNCCYGCSALFAVHSDPSCPSLILQEQLNSVQLWLEKWRIALNATKSVHVTLTTLKANCPPVSIYGQTESANILECVYTKDGMEKTHNIQEKRTRP